MKKTLVILTLLIIAALGVWMFSNFYAGGISERDALSGETIPVGLDTYDDQARARDMQVTKTFDAEAVPKTESDYMTLGSIGFMIPNGFEKSVVATNTLNAADGYIGTVFRTTDYVKRTEMPTGIHNETDILEGAQISVAFGPNDTAFETAKEFTDFHETIDLDCSNCRDVKVINVDNKYPAVSKIIDWDNGGGSFKVELLVNDQILRIGLSYGKNNTDGEFRETFEKLLDSIEF